MCMTITTSHVSKSYYITMCCVLSSQSIVDIISCMTDDRVKRREEKSKTRQWKRRSRRL